MRPERVCGLRLCFFQMTLEHKQQRCSLHLLYLQLSTAKGGLWHCFQLWTQERLKPGFSLW